MANTHDVCLFATLQVYLPTHFKGVLTNQLQSLRIYVYIALLEISWTHIQMVRVSLCSTFDRA